MFFLATRLNKFGYSNIDILIFYLSSLLKIHLQSTNESNERVILVFSDTDGKTGNDKDYANIDETTRDEDTNDNRQMRIAQRCQHSSGKMQYSSQYSSGILRSARKDF